MMKTERVRKIVAAVAVAGSLGWLVLAGLPLVLRWISSERDFGDWFFMGVMGLLVALPAGYGVWWGIRLFRRLDLDSLKGLIGLASAFVGLCAALAVKHMAAFAGLPKNVGISLYGLGAASFAVLLYVAVARKVLSVLGDELLRKRDLLNRGMIALVAFTLHGALASLAREFMARGGSSEWGLVRDFGPMFVALFFYLTIVCHLPAKEARQRRR